MKKYDKSLTDEARMIDLLATVSVSNDELCRALLDYGFGRISRRQMLEKLEDLKFWITLCSKALDLYVDIQKNAMK